MSDMMRDPPSAPGTTCDMFLGDRLTIRQPQKGYRAGVDAVLLAASVDATPQGRETGPLSLLDAGAGVGTVGLCAAARCPDLTVVLLEREPVFVDLATENIHHNGLEARVRAVCASVTATATKLMEHGLTAESFDLCVANPPFHDEEAGTPSAHRLKSAAHAMAADGLEDWCRFMARMLRPSGRATMIHKADALPAILTYMAPRFGALTVVPVYPREAAAAIRVIVQGTKGSRAPLQVRRGLVLHGHEGHGFTPQATAILRHGAALHI